MIDEVENLILQLPLFACLNSVMLLEQLYPAPFQVHVITCVAPPSSALLPSIMRNGKFILIILGLLLKGRAASAPTFTYGSPLTTEKEIWPFAILLFIRLLCQIIVHSVSL